MGLVAMILGIAAAYLAAAFVLQRSVLFPSPSASRRTPTLPPGATLARIGSAGDVEAWLLPPTPMRQPYPVVVFTHGNGELIDHWVDGFEPVRRSGLAVLLVEYPGYGRSGGSASEASITDAIVSAYDWVVQRPDVDPQRIVAWGRSIGSGAACALARERRLAALILESSFTSVRALARGFGVPGPLVRDPFDNLSVVRDLELPVLVLHGERDGVIPFSHGEALARATGTPLLRLPCGHDDCVRPWRELIEFLSLHASPPAGES